MKLRKCAVLNSLAFVSHVNAERGRVELTKPTGSGEEKGASR